MHHLLRSPKCKCYNLRTLSHGLSVNIELHEKSFINRLMFNDCYWLCLCLHSFIVLYLLFCLLYTHMYHTSDMIVLNIIVILKIIIMIIAVETLRPMNSIGLQVPQRLRKAHYTSFHWPTRERLPLPTSVSSYPAFQCSRCAWHFCPHAHWWWFLAVPA